VFLDVDDLKDISALEMYIQESATVLIFLSRGYFLSKNCLREAYSSASNFKPLILVHEADPSKGGLQRVDSENECPPDLRDYVFCDNHPLIR